jgi:putative membrane protein
MGMGIGSVMGLGFGMMWIFWILVIGAIVFVLVAVTKGVRRSPRGANSPEEILRRRYALGEINQAEYQKRLQDLRP